MPLSDADQQNLKSLWLIYCDPSGAAPKKETEAKCWRSLTKLAKSLQDPAKKAAQERLAEMKTLITVEMVGKLK
jgi:hypothetical protein